MNIQKIEYKIKCDCPGCTNLAKFAIQNKKTFTNVSIHMCEECTRQIYTQLGKIFVPKSPKNLLNKGGK